MAGIVEETAGDVIHYWGSPGAAKRILVADAAVIGPGVQVLDVGAGLGGPARWLASQFGCHVTCLDLTPEFCEAAVALTKMTGLTSQVDCGF